MPEIFKRPVSSGGISFNASQEPQFQIQCPTYRILAAAVGTAEYSVRLKKRDHSLVYKKRNEGLTRSEGRRFILRNRSPLKQAILGNMCLGDELQESFLRQGRPSSEWIEKVRDY